MIRARSGGSATPMPPRTGRRWRRTWTVAATFGTCASLLAVALIPDGLYGAAPEEGSRQASVLPADVATSRGSTDHFNAFSNASGNLGFEREFDFKIGNAIFRKLWVSAPASTRSSDGLGPLYNARSCQRCHLKDGRGHPPEANWPDDNATSMILRLSVPPATETERRLLAEGRINAVPEPTYGLQLQDFAVQGHRAEGRIHITYTDVEVRLADGEIVKLRKPTYRIEDPGYGPLHPGTMLSPRVAPQMIGLGLLEIIPETDILALADPDDRDGDGISGRPNHAWSTAGNELALGRFGWKAGAPDIPQQTAEAFAADMGLSTSLVPRHWGDCTGRQSDCRAAPDGRGSDGYEVSDRLLKLVTFYARNLAVPARRSTASPEVAEGERIFTATGCAACHKPSFRTGPSTESPHLANLTIWPYTDLLLHDMGPDLADDRPDGRATGREWRTAPLWGIGLTKVVNGHTYFLHDGRARSIMEAILWHDGEAKRSTDRFKALSKRDRERLIAFVNSL